VAHAKSLGLARPGRPRTPTDPDPGSEPRMPLSEADFVQVNSGSETCRLSFEVIA
jgi:hypothetical protein